MKTFNRILSRNLAVVMVLILGAGCGVQQATAQYDNNGYNNQGYNNNGYNNQGYNNNGYNDQGYNNNGYNNNGYNNNQGYDNNGYYGYDNGNYQEFYNDLAPYGQWLSDPQYGYVWAPYGAGNNFRPYYTNGYWAMTEYGNTWVSNYPWGWAAFHYGRWAQSNYYGWIWIPGNTWGPAWVNWRQGGGYYGWAPMGPGISISISFGSGYSVPNPWWTFIPCGNIYARDYSRYYAPRQTVNIINNTTIINNTYVDNRSRNTYVSGPRRQDIEATTRQKVNVYQISNADRNGAAQIKGQNISIYRPTIQKATAVEQARIAPPQVKRVESTVISNNGGGRAPARIVNQAGNTAAPATRTTVPGRITTGQQNGTISTNPQNGRTQQQAPTRVTQGNLNAQQTQRAQQVQQQGQETQRIQQQQQVQQQRIQQQQQQAQQQAQQQRIQQQQAQQVQQQRIQQQQQQAQQQRIQQQQQQAQQQAQQQRIQQQQQQAQQQAQQQRIQQQQQQQAQQQRIQQQQQQAQQQQRAQQQQMQQQQRVQQEQARPVQAAPRSEGERRER